MTESFTDKGTLDFPHTSHTLSNNDELVGPLWDQTQDVWDVAPEGALERVVGVLLDLGWRPSSIVAALRQDINSLNQRISELNQQLLDHPCELPEHEVVRRLLDGWSPLPSCYDGPCWSKYDRHESMSEAEVLILKEMQYEHP